MADGSMMTGGQGMSDVLSGLINRLESDAKQRVASRQLVERRWVRDLAQYEGRDDDGVIANLQMEGRSTATVNVTRAKCNTFESKLFDLLFPTDDRNWGIDPTPVPEMDIEEKQLIGQVDELVEAANTAEGDDEAMAIQQEADPLAQRIRELELERQQARQQADMMVAEIDDNLVECEYAMECREVIHDATVAGTGFLKGPIPLNERVRKNWIRDDAGRYRLKFDPDSEDRFAFQHTSYWNVFPNTGARQFSQARDWMERHIMTERDLRDFAKQPGVDREAVRRLLQDGPNEVLPDYMLELDVLASDEQSKITSDDKFYIVWEYRGALDSDEMQEIMGHLLMGQDEDQYASFEIDPLIQMDAVVWFCQGEALKFAINHMDDNACIYNVFQIEKTKARLWSVGIPYLMRTQANIVNDSWRNMLDNADWGAFPILEIDTKVLQPNGAGDFVIRPREVYVRNANQANAPGIIPHEIPIHQEHYAAIIQLAMQFIDTETNVSVLAAGEQGTTTSTAGGMALLMNSVNVVFRRVVKNFDDGITSSAITKSYYFLMQFSPKEEIKGDYAVKARGSSVLLVREVQAQNLLLLASQMSVHPVLGQHFRSRELLKKLLQSMLIASDDVLKTEQELEAEAAAQAQAEQEAGPPPEVISLQLQQQVAQMNAETQMAVAEMRRETELAKFAAQHQISLEDAMARLQAIREQNASKERMQAQEAAIEGRRDDMGITRGSGGTF